MPDSNEAGSVAQGAWLPVPLNDTRDRTPQSDSYYCYIPGKTGTFQRTTSIPKNTSDDDVTAITHIVLKPDGEFFQQKYPRIVSGSSKGDVEPLRTCLLRCVLSVYSKGQFIASGGTDASLHIVLKVDPDVSELLGKDKPRFLKLLQQLRVIALCDKLGSGILGSQTARVPGSVNSKTNTVVKEIQPSTGSYSLAELEGIVKDFFRSPTIFLFKRWFGVGDAQKTRCPWHDSKDMDLSIDADDVDGGGVVCFGANNCASKGRATPFPMVADRGQRESLSKLLIAHPLYLERWTKAYTKLSAQTVNGVQGDSKYHITISTQTRPDDILRHVKEAAKSFPNLYRDATNTLVSLELNPVTQIHEIRRHDTVQKLIALIDQFAQICIPHEKFIEYTSMPHDRAAALFHRPELREGLPILERVTTNPLVDALGQKILPPGYDPNTRTYYSGPEITPRNDGLTPYLDKAISGWTGMCGSVHRSCKTGRDITHLYGAYFTEGLADSYIFTQHKHPLLRGNQKGVGKDKNSENLGFIRDRATPVDLHHTDENRINQAFGNGVYDGRRSFQVTNIKNDGPYANAMLTRWTTEESIRGAKHGGGNYVISNNNVTFILTLNEGSIDHDLLDRLLEIDFEVEGKATERKFDFDSVAYVRQYRHEIVVEIQSLYLLCVKEGRTWAIPDGTDCRFRKWMEVIGPMLERKGLKDFMKSDSTEENDVDEDYLSFVELMTRLYARKRCEKVRAREIVQICQGGSLDSGIFTSWISGKQPEGRFSKYVLMRLVGQQISIPQGEETSIRVALRRQTDSKNKSGTYWIEVLGGVEAANGGGSSVPPPAEGGGSSFNGGGSGGNCSDCGGTNTLPPATQTLTNECLTQFSGGSGGKSLEVPPESSSEYQTNTEVDPINTSIAYPQGSTPAAPATPAPALNSTETDPWNGATL